MHNFPLVRSNTFHEDFRVMQKDSYCSKIRQWHLIRQLVSITAPCDEVVDTGTLCLLGLSSDLASNLHCWIQWACLLLKEEASNVFLLPRRLLSPSLLQQTPKPIWWQFLLFSDASLCDFSASPPVPQSSVSLTPAPPLYHWGNWSIAFPYSIVETVHWEFWATEWQPGSKHLQIWQNGQWQGRLWMSWQSLIDGRH